ncbi:MAG: DUF4340 domain-containing protein, partial [Saprospiraceae bacterium]|nr:DUF4340 domain-containing protein [Saprospiraceae bacterium]
SRLISYDRYFVVENIDDVNKIFIANRNGEKTTLEKIDGVWMYNTKYKARPTVVKNILKTLHEMKMKYGVPKSMVKGVIEDLAVKGIKVEVYDKRDNKLKSFYIGGVTQDETGTMMIMEDADVPYVVHLPSKQQNLRIIFDMQGDDWRDRTFLSEKFENIKTLSVNYPNFKAKSFTIINQKSNPYVKPLYEDTPLPPGELNKGKVVAYLNQFENLVAENFRNNYDKKDSISQTVPFVQFKIETNDGKQEVCTFYPIYIVVNTDELVLDRHFVEREDGQFYIIQDLAINKIFKDYFSFFTK